MRKGGGHAKGAEFERWVAKELSLWASDGQRKDIFWRTPGSGARSRFTGTDAAHRGDICATHELGRLFCEFVLTECKSYRRIDWRQFLVDRRGEFFDFWIQLVKDSADAGNLIPLFIVKENARAVLACTSKKGRDQLYFQQQPLLNNRYGVLVFPFVDLFQSPYQAVVKRLYPPKEIEIDVAHHH